jgi:hypothetical protein
MDCGADPHRNTPLLSILARQSTGEQWAVADAHEEGLLSILAHQSTVEQWAVSDPYPNGRLLSILTRQSTGEQWAVCMIRTSRFNSHSRLLFLL